MYLCTICWKVWNWKMGIRIASLAPSQSFWRHRKPAILCLISLCETSANCMSETHLMVSSFHNPWVENNLYKMNTLSSEKKFFQRLACEKYRNIRGVFCSLGSWDSPLLPGETCWNSDRCRQIFCKPKNHDATAFGWTCCLHFRFLDYLGLLSHFFLLDFL